MNAAQHRIASAVTIAAAAASIAREPKDRLPNAAAGCIGGYCFATLPDVVEPATSPHHRQFFHSLLFAGILGYGLYKLYGWDPETPEAEASARRRSHRWQCIPCPLGPRREHLTISSANWSRWLT